MENQNLEDDLTSIRSLMERSSKFISLSGMSGIMAGIYALIGSIFAYYQIYDSSGFFQPKVETNYFEAIFVYADVLKHLLFIAIVVLMAAIGTGILLTMQKAKKNGQSIRGITTRSLIFHTAIPLVTGGLFMLILLTRGYYGMVAPASLIFYGIALICGSHYTFTDVKYLGLFEIILGLVAALWPGYGLLFWAMGFGVLHIIYGSMMHFKYDR